MSLSLLLNSSSCLVEEVDDSRAELSLTPRRWKLVPGFFLEPGEAPRPSRRTRRLAAYIAPAEKVKSWTTEHSNPVHGGSDRHAGSPQDTRSHKHRTDGRIFKHGNGEGASKKWQTLKTDYAKLLGPKKLHKNLKWDESRISEEQTERAQNERMDEPSGSETRELDPGTVKRSPQVSLSLKS